MNRPKATIAWSTSARPAVHRLCNGNGWTLYRPSALDNTTRRDDQD